MAGAFFNRFLLILLGGVSQLNPELTDMTSLHSQLESGILCLCLLSAEVTGRLHQPGIYTVVEISTQPSHLYGQYFNLEPSPCSYV